MTNTSNSNSKERAWQFLLILGAHFLFLALAIITAIFYLFPEKLVDGTYLTLVATLVTTIATRLESHRLISISFISSILLHIDRNFGRYTLWTLALIFGCSLWVALMFNSFIDRFKYVEIVREAMQPLTLEAISLPDPAQLAKAFYLFPNRREAAFLLARASRIFHHGNQTAQFSRYQEHFVAALEKSGLDNLQERVLEGLGKGNKELNGLHFFARVNAEARGNSKSYIEEDSDDRAKAAAVDKAIAGVEQSISWLNSAPKIRTSSGEMVADYEARLMKLTLDFWISSLRKDSLQAIWEESESLNKELDNLSPEALANLYQSHIFQEFLDLQAFLVSFSLKNDENYASDSENVGEALDNYRRILMLRAALAHTGQVQWIVAPTKLTLFHLFMEAGGAKTSVSDQQNEIFTDHKDFRSRLALLLSSSAFEKFKHPEAWYKGTPMDPGLNGSALTDKIEHWLRKGW